ncbi:MAG TPA: DegT/DnrJ/EryC1/StrS family aminotransferase, partial [Leptospiraceae bacterium]|nr:DegT/DnrJ/EryC1/StrS family aminotransferase [Leptospiraceae bacterium]
RMPDILAALGLSQLRRAEEGLARRRAIARRYDSAFANSSAAPMIPTESELHAYHLYIVRVENRRAVYDRLREKGILAQVHYVPVHLQPFYRRLGFGPGDFPAAEQFYSSAISLPMFPGLSDSDVDRVIASVLESVE